MMQPEAVNLEKAGRAEHFKTGNADVLLGGDAHGHFKGPADGSDIRPG
jgi:hypothetical protein